MIAAQHITPLLLAVQDAPVPFTGSDGHAQLVYQLWIGSDLAGVNRLGDAILPGLQRWPDREGGSRPVAIQAATVRAITRTFTD